MRLAAGGQFLRGALNRYRSRPPAAHAGGVGEDLGFGGEIAGFYHRGRRAALAGPGGKLNGEPPEFLRQAYGELSPDGIGHYEVVVAKLAAMHAGEPALTEADLRQVAVRTLIMVGDDDEVRLEHAIAMYRSMPDAELAVVPGTSHGLLVEKPALCNLLITEFLANDPVQTFAPIRRAGQAPSEHETA